MAPRKKPESISKDLINKMIEQQKLVEIIKDILNYFPNKPFLCLPLSAMLYAGLKDHLKIESNFVTGNLLYEGNYIFKQDFSIRNSPPEKLELWAGHAWIELSNQIIDLSFFRTLYSEQFKKPYKENLIQHFGEGRGCVIGSKQQLEADGLTYQAIDYLEDQTATSIIKGIQKLPIWH